MSWQITLASCAAQNMKPGLPVNPDPAAPAIVELDTVNGYAGLVYTNDNITVENPLTNNLNCWAMGVKPIPATSGKVYWEIYIDALGVNSGTFYMGAVADITSSSFEGNLTSPLTFFSVSMNNVHLFGSNYGNDFIAGNLAVGDTIGFVLDPDEGKVWVYKNGVLLSGTYPDTPSMYVIPFLSYFPFINPRDNGDRFTLKSIAAQFNYAVPSGALPYGNDLINYNKHELTLRNDYCKSRNNSTISGSFDFWDVENGMSIRRNFTEGGATFLKNKNSLYAPDGFHGSGTTYWYFSYPSTNGQTHATLSQTVNIPETMFTLVDEGEYALEMEAYISYMDTATPTNSGLCFVATFYDETDSEISVEISDKSEPDGGHMNEKFNRFINVPPLTRKIKLGYRQFKQSSGTDRRAIVTLRRARLHRLTNLVKVVKSAIRVVAGNTSSLLKIRRTNVHVILSV